MSGRTGASWKGKPLSDMTGDELREAIVFLNARDDADAVLLDAVRAELTARQGRDSLLETAEGQEAVDAARHQSR